MITTGQWLCMALLVLLALALAIYVSPRTQPTWVCVDTKAGQQCHWERMDRP